MAVPDWPLSFGVLNPAGWWKMHGVNLEHGHRQMAETVGLLITILSALVWRNKRALAYGAIVLVVLVGVAVLFSAPKVVVFHLGVWSFALTFAGALLFTSGPAGPGESRVRKIAFAAFIGVCIQAVIGGLRVTQNVEMPTLALAFRILHGCVAQVELCLLVALAVYLSPAWVDRPLSSAKSGISRLCWALVFVVFGQLIVGAAMRHMIAGLAIPTFPYAGPDGAWMPAIHTKEIDLNFTHTRVGAFLVTVMLIWTAISTLKHASAEKASAIALLAMLLIQITLGVLVIWHFRPPFLTTFHMWNGALILALSLRLALRTSATEEGERFLNLNTQRMVAGA